MEVLVMLMQQDEYHVAYCPVLQLTAFGLNDEEAKTAFEKALQEFLDGAVARGSLQDTLTGMGWQVACDPVVAYHPPESALEGMAEGGFENFYRMTISFPIT